MRDIRVCGLGFTARRDCIRQVSWESFQVFRSPGTCHPGSMQSLCIDGRVINSRFEPAKNCTGDPILHWSIDVDTCDNGREVSVSACQTTTSTTVENTSVEPEVNMTNNTTTGAASVSRGKSIAAVVWSTLTLLGQCFLW